MKLTAKLLTGAALLTASATAMAHSGHAEGGFTSGLLHPMLGLDHLLAMAAIGFWSVRQVIDDPAGDHDWDIHATVDLAQSAERGEAVVRVEGLKRL